MKQKSLSSSTSSSRTSAVARRWRGSVGRTLAAPRAVGAEAPVVVADERRTFDGPLPPTGAKNTQLVTIKEGLLWSLRQDFPESGPKSIWLNCSVARLSTGGLLVYSPVAPTPEALEQIASLPGRVEHIVAPSLSPEHWLYVNAFARSHADATIWFCPGLTEVNLPGIGDAKISAGTRVREIGPDMASALGGEVDFALFVGPFGLFKEAALCARHARAVFCGDLFFGAFEDEGMPTALQRKIGDIVGIRRKIGAPVAFLQMLLSRAAAREWWSKVDAWDFDTVTGGHLSAGINTERYGVDGKVALREAFKFVS